MNDDPEADIHEFPLTRPRVKKLRLLLVLSGLGLLALVSTAFGMMMAVASDVPKLLPERTTPRNSAIYDVHGQKIGVLSGNEKWLLAVNAGSNSISVLQVRRRGLRLVEVQPRWRSSSERDRAPWPRPGSSTSRTRR